MQINMRAGSSTRIGSPQLVTAGSCTPYVASSVLREVNAESHYVFGPHGSHPLPHGAQSPTVGKPVQPEEIRPVWERCVNEGYGLSPRVSSGMGAGFPLHVEGDLVAPEASQQGLSPVGRCTSIPLHRKGDLASAEVRERLFSPRLFCAPEDASRFWHLSLQRTNNLERPWLNGYDVMTRQGREMIAESATLSVPVSRMIFAGSHGPVTAEDAWRTQQKCAEQANLRSEAGGGYGYEVMICDDVRTSGYADAIRKAVVGKRVLEIGTGDCAVLAMLCASAGATHVTAVEVVPAIAERARGAIQRAGLAHCVDVIAGHSATTALPEVDIIIHEIVGSIATEEGVAAVLKDLQNRPDVIDSKKKGWSIPKRIETIVAPVAFPAGAPPILSQRMTGSAGVFDVVDCEAPVELLQTRVLSWPVTQQIQLAGFACGPRLLLDDDITLDSFKTHMHWDRQFVPVMDPEGTVPLAAGDAVIIQIEADLRRFPTVHKLTMMCQRMGAQAREILGERVLVNH